MQAFCTVLLYVAMYDSVQQREKLVDILLTKDGSAILKALEILKTRECGYTVLVGRLFTAMDALQKETCTKPAESKLHHLAHSALVMHDTDRKLNVISKAFLCMSCN